MLSPLAGGMLGPLATAMGVRAFWRNAVNVSVADRVLTKTSGTNGVWNAGASSTASLKSGDGYVETVVSAPALYRLFGLNNGDPDQSFGLRHCVSLQGATMVARVFEAGADKGATVSYVVGDTIRVGIESGVVKYRKNGTLFYTSLLAPAYPCVVDTSLRDTGAVINGVTIGGGAWS